MTDTDVAMVFVVDDDPQVRASIQGLLKLAGLRSECFETAEQFLQRQPPDGPAVQLPALTASNQGYRVYVVVDACGGVNERTEQAALQRMIHGGAIPVSVMTLAGELAGDFREEKAQQAIAVLYEMAKP